MKKLNEWINKEETGINHELFKKYFKMQWSSDMLKAVYTANYKNKNNNLLNMINSGLDNLKNEI